MSNRLGGFQGTAYLGTKANQPPNTIESDRNPTPYDVNFSRLDIWLNTVTNEKWVLDSLEGDANSKGVIAAWSPWNGAGGGLISLSGITNPATLVQGDGGGNIQFTTTIPGLNINGDAGNHRIILSAASGVGGLLTRLQGNVVGGGPAVSPDANHTIYLESTIPALVFTSIGANPHTINLELTGAGPKTIVQALAGDTGTRVSPDANGIININSIIPGLTVVELPGTNQLLFTSSSGYGFVQTLTGDDAIPVDSDSSGNINLISGLTGMEFVQTAPNEITLKSTGTGPTTFLSTLEDNFGDQVPCDANGNVKVVGDAVNIVTTADIPNNTLTINYIGVPPPVTNFAWQQVAGAAQALVSQNGYIANNPVQTIFTLPVLAAIGDTFAVTGMNTNLGWRVSQNGGQTIYFGEVATTPGAGGYLESTRIRDTVFFVCTDTNTSFSVVSSIGNITVV